MIIMMLTMAQYGTRNTNLTREKRRLIHSGQESCGFRAVQCWMPSSDDSPFTSLVMIYVSKSPVFEIMQLPFIGAFFCGRLMCLFPVKYYHKNIS